MKARSIKTLKQRVVSAGGIKAVTFDLDDTLWPVWPAVGRAEQAMMEWLQQHAPRIVEKFGVDGLRELRDQIAKNRPELSYHISLMRILAMREAAATAGYSPELGEQAFEVMWQARNRVDLFEDVFPALHQLESLGLTVGALSNGNADIDQVGLGGFFDFALNAVSGGAPKPHRVMFERAAKLANCQCQQIAHVGDDLNSDIAGAAAAGMVTIWLNRDSGKSTSQLADFEISSLSQLSPILDQLLSLTAQQG